mmetsp:Transcript_5775/g.18806  ORF Transcript_5775/g.18806 Transcript_5775/m.18806 type:complete len:225 (+) Transcript_5775:1292-1966(+)
MGHNMNYINRRTGTVPKPGTDQPTGCASVSNVRNCQRWRGRRTSAILRLHKQVVPQLGKNRTTRIRRVDKVSEVALGMCTRKQPFLGAEPDSIVGLFCPKGFPTDDGRPIVQNRDLGTVRYARVRPPSVKEEGGVLLQLELVVPRMRSQPSERGCEEVDNPMPVHTLAKPGHLRLSRLATYRSDTASNLVPKHSNVPQDATATGGMRQPRQRLVAAVGGPHVVD